MFLHSTVLLTAISVVDALVVPEQDNHADRLC